MQLKLKELTIENLFSYGEDHNYIDFELANLSLILGQTNGNLSLSNGTGKSAIFNSILWALYGRLLSGKALDSIVRPGCAKGKVTLSLFLDDKKMTIIRSRDIKQQKTSLELYLDGSSLSSEILVETEKKIVQLIGLSFLMFRNSLYFGQEDLDHFCIQSVTEKKNLFTSIIKLHILDKALDKVKNFLVVLNDTKNKILHEKEWLNQEKATYPSLTDLKTKLQLCKEESLLLLDKQKKLFMFLNTQKDCLYAVEQDLKDLDISISDYSTLSNEISSLIQKKQKEEEQYTSNKQLLKHNLALVNNALLIFVDSPLVSSQDLIIIDEKLKELNNSFINYCKKEREIELILEATGVKKQELTDRLTFLNKSEQICPLCETTITSQKAAELKDSCLIALSSLSMREKPLSSKLQRIVISKVRNESIQKNLEEKKISLCLKLRNLEEMTEKKLEKIALQEQLLSLVTYSEKSLNILSVELTNKQEKLNSFVSDFDVIGENLFLKKKEYQNGIVASEFQIENVDLMLRESAATLFDIEKSIEKVVQFNSRLDQLQINCSNTDKEIKTYEILKKSFGSKGIKTYIIEDMLAIFELRINEYVKSLFDYSVSVSFVTQKVKKGSTDEMIEQFDIVVASKGIIKSYSCFSPGEKRRFDLAIKLALADLIKYNSGVIPQFLFFDEAMDSLDEDGRLRFLSLLNQLSETIDIILVVSHEPAFQEYFRDIIVLDKSEDISKIVSF